MGASILTHTYIRIENTCGCECAIISITIQILCSALAYMRVCGCVCCTNSVKFCQLDLNMLTQNETSQCSVFLYPKLVHPKCK